MPSLISLLESQLNDNYSVLDVGCGRSSFLRYVKKPLFKVGVDLYEPYIDKIKAMSIHNSYVIGDGCELSFKSKSFDCAIATEVIEHLSKADGLRMIKEMERVARKKIIITTPNGFFSAETGPEDNPEEKHVSGWDTRELKTLGFKIYGFGGLKMLQERRKPRRLIARILLAVILKIGDLFVYYCPSIAFQLFCFKELEI